MTKYELALVVNAVIEDEAREAVLNNVKDMIAKLGATEIKVEDAGKKRLAYDIQKMSEGYYYFIQFDAETSVPAQIEAKVRIMENVLRFLCIR
ncbi:MAG: 30S ribosomal protein S6, partial [Lachnospiraceae bacterium]|nr:30S ribosomal protein S6 [Lachnospiraceae bacterium]